MARALPRFAFLRRAARSLGLLDRRCLLCGNRVTPPPAGTSRGSGLMDALCPDCAVELRPRIGGYCPLCGSMPFDSQAPPAPCGKCLRRAKGREKPLAWSALAFYAPYSGVLRQSLLEFKLNSRLGMGALMRRLVLETWELRCQKPEWSGWRPDLVVPVPLYPGKLLRRGFNQSHELARPLAEKLGVPLSDKALRRVRDTVPQFSLRHGQRAENIKDAFATFPSLVAQHKLLLVDDIMTTGATLEECCRTLRRGGALDIRVLVLARTAEE